MSFSLDLTAAADPDLVVDIRDAFCLYPMPDGAVAALRGLSLQVSGGERVVVQGPNGSGKTTLLRVLIGEQPLSAGRAVVAGRDVGVGPGSRGADRLSDWRVAEVGWVDQVPARALRRELTVLQNVMLQQRLAGVRRRTARAAAEEVMARLGVLELADRSPVTLSGGEAQRVAVCAAVAHRPGLVLADEPCGQLDARTAEQVYDALARAAELAGAALVLVSHDRQAARIADRVVRIRDGRLSETWSGHGREAQHGELLVVDDRGWVRLPESLRREAGGPRSLVARLGEPHPEGTPRIELTPVDPAPVGPAPGPVASAVGAGGEPVVTLSGVRKGHGDRLVLDGVELVVRTGRLHVLRGRSGSGKSTLLRLLIGLERPDAGTVTVTSAVTATSTALTAAGPDSGPVELAALDRDGLARLRRGLSAFVGQDVHLAETLSLRANVALSRDLRAAGGPQESGGDVADPTRRGVLDLDVLDLDALDLDVLGLGTLADRPVEQLSGGERQRAAVTRALCAGARLVVLDEPTSQLDEASAEQLAAALVAAARSGAAVVVATHDPVVVAAADEVTDLEEAAPNPR